MKILYIFPHPDDESFGPAHVMSKQSNAGHEVYLLTLTKGGATNQRLKLNLSIEEMGNVRYKEMLNVKKVLNLKELTVLDLPDSGLKEMNPALIESEIKKQIERIKPEVIVTYPVHGISGFPDHLVTHAVVKNVYCEMKEKSEYLKRLAFFTVTKETSEKQKHFKLTGSSESDIDCIETVEQQDIDNAIKSLDCYVTYHEIIEATNIKSHIESEVVFEIFQETYDPNLKNILENI